MFLLAPTPEALSNEIEAWREDFRARLEKFTTAHPDFPALKSIKIPETLPDEEKGFHLRAELNALLLPSELAGAPFWQSARIKPWPIVLRTRYAINQGIFRYWSCCIGSQEYEHSIHIFGDFNDLPNESDAAARRERVCIDMTALLTLAELDLLSLLTEFFDLILIASGTRHSVWMESSSIVAPHALAEKISTWMTSNRNKIRTRDGRTSVAASAEDDPYLKSTHGVLMEKKDWPLDVVLSDGIGESLNLAKKLGIPLYSDESVVRQWATDDHGVPSFSTLGLVDRLVKEGRWTIDQHTELIVQLIKRNYRWVPFDVTHLNSRLRHVIDRPEDEGISLTSEHLRSDEELKTLMLWFGDTQVTEEIRLSRALNWWLSILESGFFEKSILVTCMEYPVHCYIMASTEPVERGKIRKFEREEKAAKLLAIFLWKAYITVERRTEEVWFSIKDCAERLFVDSADNQHDVLFRFMPKWLLKAANADRSIDGDKKTGYLYDLTSRLPDSDKEPFETGVVKAIAKFG